MKKKGFLCKDPSLVFFTSYRAEDFEKCKNIGFTKGNFKKHKLPTNEEHCNGKENDSEEDNDNEEENEEDIQVNSQGVIYDDEEDPEEIEIIQEKLELQDLNRDNYVIITVPVEPIKKKSEIVQYYVAKITHIVDEEEIEIDFLEQDFDYHQKFRNASKDCDIGMGTELSEIVMVLPEPDRIRGGVIFPRRINLKKK